MRYHVSIREQAQNLRKLGKTHTEIQTSLRTSIPKSTLSYWCQNIALPPEYTKKVALLNVAARDRGRVVAWELGRLRRQVLLEEIEKRNTHIIHEINNYPVAKIALAMLCLGEASKYKSSSSFALGSSDKRIIVIFLALLKQCFAFQMDKVRCTVQCRADQNITDLEEYWREVTGIPKQFFYKAQVDPGTIGKPTKKEGYKGVLRVDYFDRKAQLELESLADLVYNQLSKVGPVA